MARSGLTLVKKRCRARYGLLHSRSSRVLALVSAYLPHATYAAGGAVNRENPVAVFEVVQVDTAKAKVKGLLRIRNPTPDTLFLFPLNEAFPLGQIEVTLYRGEHSEVFRAYGALDVSCYTPDTLLPGDEFKHTLTLGHRRWWTEDPNPAQGRSVSQVVNPLLGGVRAIGLKYQLRLPIEELKEVDSDGFDTTVRDCPYRYYPKPIVAPPVEVNLPG